MSVSLDSALPDPRATRRSFDRATSFDAASFAHDETRRRLLERLDLFDLAPRVAVDLGCATGRGAVAVAGRYPAARVLAVDSSAGMLRAARRRVAAVPSVAALGGDAERLPLRDHSVQLVLANLVLPWCRPPALFAEAARTLEEGGLLLFATLGPDSFKELRAAWGAVDSALHVHAAFDLHDVGDLALAGGGNAARFAITLELVLGQAWGRGSRPTRRSQGSGEIAVPLATLRRRSSRQ